MSDQPTPELDTRFSHPEASRTSWADARERIEQAGVYWLSTVRPNGAPHVTPLVGVWHEGAAWFCTGAAEQKGRNLDRNPRLVLTTGCNDHDEGPDSVVPSKVLGFTRGQHPAQTRWTAPTAAGWAVSRGRGIRSPAGFPLARRQADPRGRWAARWWPWSR